MGSEIGKPLLVEGTSCSLSFAKMSAAHRACFIVRAIQVGCIAWWLHSPSGRRGVVRCNIKLRSSKRIETIFVPLWDATPVKRGVSVFTKMQIDGGSLKMQRALSNVSCEKQGSVKQALFERNTFDEFDLTHAAA